MDNNEPIEIELSTTGRNLYIFFGGIAAGIAMPPFEFYNSSKIIDENKIFVRDFDQCWYQNGLPGISKDVRSTAWQIQTKIKEIAPQKTFFVGNSMGGYAAIMFAHLVDNVDQVIAFAPQTFISPFLRFKHKDSRWKKQITRTYRRSALKEKIWNLKPLLLNVSNGPKVSVYVSKDNFLDYAHASYVKDVPGVEIHEFERGGHALVKWLRDEGKLPAIMSGRYFSFSSCV